MALSWGDIFSVGSQIGGAIVNARTTYDKAKASEASADAQRIANEAAAVLAENNAKMAEWQRSDAIIREQSTENAVRLRGAAVKSTQLAVMAAGGIDTTVGSAQRVMLSTDVGVEQDVETVRANTAKEAFAYEAQAVDARNRAEIARNAFVQEGVDPTRATLSSLLTSASTIGSTAYSLSKRK